MEMANYVINKLKIVTLVPETLKIWLSKTRGNAIGKEKI